MVTYWLFCVIIIFNFFTQICSFNISITMIHHYYILLEQTLLWRISKQLLQGLPSNKADVFHSNGPLNGAHTYHFSVLSFSWSLNCQLRQIHFRHRITPPHYKSSAGVRLKPFYVIDSWSTFERISFFHGPTSLCMCGWHPRCPFRRSMFWLYFLQNCVTRVCHDTPFLQLRDAFGAAVGHTHKFRVFVPRTCAQFAANGNLRVGSVIMKCYSMQF